MERIARTSDGVVVTDQHGESAQACVAMPGSLHLLCWLMLHGCVSPPQFDELVFACGAEEAKRMLGSGASG